MSDGPMTKRAFGVVEVALGAVFGTAFFGNLFMVAMPKLVDASMAQRPLEAEMLRLLLLPPWLQALTGGLMLLWAIAYLDPLGSKRPVGGSASDSDEQRRS